MCHRQQEGGTRWNSKRRLPLPSGRMAEIAAYYNGLPGVKPVKKFESRDMAVTRIWTAVSRDKPNVARKTKAGRKGKQPKTRKASKPGS
jgi:hypothetical protein